MAVTRVVLIIEYDGRCYHGSQLQVGLATIQEEIEQAIRDLTGKRCRIAAASRTDAGVHACGQVVSFLTNSILPEQTFVRGLNYYLPRDIAVKAAYRVATSFDVRRDAVSREYSYYILNGLTRSPIRRGFVHLVGGHLDIEAINEACQALLGRHDFASFASATGVNQKCTVRCVYRAVMEKRGELVVFNMVANSFLPHQVRNTVGMLIKVGMGRVSLSEFRSIIEARVPGLAGPMAPACGLRLMRVNYPVSFGGETL
ncbi:MAG: tRNA pseudouridine(38-40) synthase TruA [Dehalococcoidales bacterium]|nr:tRNA pseudouridine(38-40) synthase TruA [Dehalococcoidales bacterium]